MASFSSLLVAALAVTSAFASPLGLEPRQQQQPFRPRPGYFPPTGDDTIAGGIFCISLTDLAAYLARTGNNPGATGSETPRGAGVPGPGSGPYPARVLTDPSLPGHTIYAPQTPPAGNVSLGFIAWGNGGCAMSGGSEYRNFLLEIASHGYVVSADGPVAQNRQSLVTDMRASVDWAVKGGASKYGNIDVDNIITAGHSCGGLSAMSTAYNDPRVKRIMLFNIAIFQDERRYLLEKINVPVAWFVGGPKDMGYPNAEKDYKLLPGGVPAYKASLDTGHGGTFGATNGGKFGKAAVAYLQWQFRKDEKSKQILLDAKTPGSLVTDKWTVEYKNWS
ncbi:hypothetical protein RB595_008211 [Gaeumannomyces hyphopodioides]